MRLATAVPAVALEKHHRGREARTGADWEWWVGRPGLFVGMRVQAKILNPSTGEYSSLFSSRATALKQVEKLIAGATAGPRRTFPLYAFYNYWGLIPYGKVTVKCGRLGGEPEPLGWTVSSAHALRERLSVAPSKKFRDLQDLMLPVSCLFCCPPTCGVASASNLRSLGMTIVEAIGKLPGERNGEVYLADDLRTVPVVLG
jgi:Family of unknown function (DUF6615)